MLSATYVNTYVCMYKLFMYHICPYEGLARIEGRTERTRHWSAKPSAQEAIAVLKEVSVSQSYVI